MKEVSIVGLDLAKRVFQAHGAGADGGVIFRRKLSRSQVLAFFMGCGTEKLERAKGIEPSYAAWEAAVLPLNYARAPAASAPIQLSIFNGLA